MAQSVERFTRNEQVISSNLITSSKNKNVFSDVLFLLKIEPHFRLPFLFLFPCFFLVRKNFI